MGNHYILKEMLLITNHQTNKKLFKRVKEIKVDLIKSIKK